MPILWWYLGTHFISIPVSSNYLHNENNAWCFINSNSSAVTHPCTNKFLLDIANIWSFYCSFWNPQIFLPDYFYQSVLYFSKPSDDVSIHPILKLLDQHELFLHIPDICLKSWLSFSDTSSHTPIFFYLLFFF